MEFDEAVRHALDGDAVLFLGAGFSLGATNANDHEFPLGTNLSRDLMVALGETETVPLQTASQLYSDSRGNVGLLSFLKDHLGLRAVAPHHKLFAKPKWRRVYTTNYDDVFEAAAREEGQSIRPLVLTPEIPPPDGDCVDCIHINGYLPWANAANLHDQLILSETAYLTDRFTTSAWAGLLRSDAKAARAVLFVGYSMADLDIGRVLAAVGELKHKCVFVVGPEPSLATRTKLKPFGTLAEITGVEASAVIEQISATHLASPRRVNFISFRHMNPVAASTVPPTKEDIFDLFVKGEPDEGQILRDLGEPSPSYLIRRREAEGAAEAFSGGARTVVLLGRLANGKSMLGVSVAAELRDRFDVFVFLKAALTLGDEIRALRQPSRPTLILIDDYDGKLDLVAELRMGASSNQYLLLTSRTPSHLVNRDKFEAAICDPAYRELRADSLRDADLAVLDGILSDAGLLGELAKWKRERRIQHYRAGGAAEFSGILLWLLDSQHIRERLTQKFTSLRGKDRHARKVVITAMVLRHLNQTADIDDIAEFIGADSINHAMFAEDSDVAELVRLEGRAVQPYSSLFAAAALRALWDQGLVAEVLKQMLDVAWKRRRADYRFGRIARDVMRFSSVRQIVPKNDIAAQVNWYYEQIRAMPACAENQLFWLQVAIADIEAKRFDLADRHLDTAYAIAGRSSGFRTYQIDNVRAKFLLRREIEEHMEDRAFQAFLNASRILGTQMRDREHAYYPYRVATLYERFWDRVACHWESGQREVFLKQCRAVHNHADNAAPDLAAMDDVWRCRDAMRNVLSRAGVLPAI
jgi:hypothetical protein